MLIKIDGFAVTAKLKRENPFGRAGQLPIYGAHQLADTPTQVRVTVTYLDDVPLIDRVKARLSACGESLPAFVVQIIKEEEERDKQELVDRMSLHWTR